MKKIIYILVLAAIFSPCINLKAEDVLPGDSNKNGQVDLVDFLFWGLAAGNSGAARLNATTDCEEESADDWEVKINDINGKHQDADGNGIVDINDLNVIAGNYGCNIDNLNAPLLNQDNAIFSVIEQTAFINGEAVHTFEIYVHQVDEVFGLAFSFDYGSISFGIDEDAISVDTTGTWLSASELVVIQDAEINRLDIAFTGSQPVQPDQAQPACKIIVIEDFIGDKPLSLNINLINGVSLDSRGRRTSFQNTKYVKNNLVSNSFDIKTSATNSFENLNIQLANSASGQLAYLIISSIQGIVVLKTQVLLQLGENILEVDISNLQPGIYVFNLVYEDKQFYSNKFIVQQKYRY